MPFGINICVRGGDTSPYWDLVDRASALETQPTIRALGYPPHITLGKYDEVKQFELEAAVEALARFPPLILQFKSIGSFGSGPFVLWLAPVATNALNELYAVVHKMIDPAKCSPPYRPGSWTPHCTIALRVAGVEKDAVQYFLSEGIQPFVLRFDTVDCVASPPISVIAERPLGGIFA
jgi:2'-5' RNA ligase